MDDGKFKGIVKWFSPEKGFGFISRKGKEDVFVYYTDILSDGFKVLAKGQVVEFEVFKGERGIQAKNVKIL